MKEEQKKKRIKLDKIDTTEAAQKFLELIKEKPGEKFKTYFLNGSWGSGKTEFLNVVREEAEKENLTFIELKLWEIKDNRSTITIGFSKLRPKFYCLFRIIVACVVAIAILSTSTINMGLSKWIPQNICGLVLKFGLSFATLSFSVWQVFKPKSDSFYYGNLQGKRFENRMLIIDDFDRCTEEQQEEAYKLFNALNGNLPVVFVGDFNNFVSKEHFLQKIIDVRVALPYDLHPKNIWDVCFEQLQKHFKIKQSECFTNFREWVIKDGRNLRERDHFKNYVNQELIIGDKYERVQVVQQLAVIYLYLFYPKMYSRLQTSGIKDFKHSDEYDKHYNGLGYEFTKSTEDYILTILNWSTGYPLVFKENPNAYFLNESVSNLSTSKIKDILEDNNQLEEYLEKDYKNDVFQYVSHEYDSISDELKNNLIEQTLEMFKRGKSGALIDYIIRIEDKKIMPYELAYPNSMSYVIPGDHEYKSEEEIKKIRFKKWEELLERHHFDESQKLSLMAKYYFEIEDLWGLVAPLDIGSGDFEKSKRKDYFLLVYLKQQNIFNKFDLWKADIWSKIDEMSVNDFLSFWGVLGIFSIRLESGRYFPFVAKKGRIYTLNNDSSSEYKNFKVVRDKVDIRVTELRIKGYSILQEKRESTVSN